MSRMLRIWVHLAAVMVAAVLLAGCTSRAARVDCDRRLEPINAPAKDQKRTKDASRVTTPESKS